MAKDTRKKKWGDAVFSRVEAVHAAYRHAFAPILKVQVFCTLCVFCVVLCAYFFFPASFVAMQGQYAALFETAADSASLLRFAQQAVSSLAVQVEATEAPAGTCLMQYDASQTWVQPVEVYEISSGYGWRDDPFTGASAFHSGVDFASAEGTPVYAVQEGVVERNYLSDSYGNCIMIRHADGSITLYAHLQYAFARQGEWVSTGEQIGTVGQTGAATGAHLHFEVIVNNERQDPSAALGL